MTATAFDSRKLVQIAVPLAAALIAVAASRIPAQAASDHTLVIPASDGYGFDDCLGSNKACGRVIADAWCEAHGMSASLAFGRAEDVTAAIPAKPAGGQAQAQAGAAMPKFSPGSYIVTCKD